MPSDSKPLHELAHVAHACRVEAGRGLVEQQQLRVAQKRSGDAEPLPHPVRVAADAVLAAIAQLDDVEHLLDARARDATVEIAEQVQVAAAGQIRVEARALDETGHAVQSTRSVDQRVAAEETRLALGRPDQPEQHPQRGRLAGAVRAEVAEDVASIDRQVDVVDGDDVAVALDQSSRFERRRVAHPSDRAADSAAEVGTDPASTYETPP